MEIVSEENYIQNLPNDMLFSLAIQLELPDLLTFCSSSKRINDVVCKKDDIWVYKLNREFSNWQKLKSDPTVKDPKTLIPLMNMKTPRDIYMTLYTLSAFFRLRRKLKIDTDIYKIFQIKNLISTDAQITEIPKEIGHLINLEVLSLRNNKISILPKEIGHLTKLDYLDLSDNEIKEIPKEIGNLTNLKFLDLGKNQITDIPREIGNMAALEKIYLGLNPIKELPKEIVKLTNLRQLYIPGIDNIKIPKEIKNIRRLQIHTDSIVNDLINLVKSKIY